MKILYIATNQRTDIFPFLVDYQNDCLLYGLKELFGDDVVDCNKRYNLYTDYSDEDVATEYGKGFTINPNGGQVFIEIDFKEAEDYNNDDGLLTINDSILFWRYPKEVASQIKGISYMLVEVISSFSKGKFTQELDCVINQFSDITNKSDAIAAGRPSNIQENVFDNRQSTNPNSDPNTNIGTEAQEAQESVSGTFGAGANNTNKALNASSQANDENVVNPTRQPKNEGGREDPNTGNVLDMGLG
jgi:hypothetical protein